MPTITLHVDDQDEERKLSVAADRAEKLEEVSGEVDHASVTLDREVWSDVDDVLERRTDHLIVDKDGEKWFAGRFDSDSKGENATREVHISGYERDALDAEPTAPNLVYENLDDDQVATDLLTNVPTLEAGTVETVASGISMSYSYANPSKALRDLEEPGGELRYQYDQTVDYVGRIGEDKPDVVLSPDERTIVGEPEVSEDGREEITHLRGFGAQSGPDQVTDAVTADSYDGGRQNWREYENKDIVQQSRLETTLEKRMEEIESEPNHIEVSDLQAIDVDVDLGDRVTVELPEEGIDRMLRITSRREILEATGVTFVLTLTNRLLTTEDSGRESRKDLQRFNRGYQGFIDRSQTTSGWNAAGDTHPQELGVWNWPDDIVQEQVVELAVQGRAWRSPVALEGHDHNVTIDDHAHEVTLEDHDHDVDIDDHIHVIDIEVPDHTHSINLLDASTSTDDGHSHTYAQAQPDTVGTDNEEVLEASSSEGGGVNTTTGNGGGTTETTDDGGGTTETTTSVIPLSPEVTTEFEGEQSYPSDVTIEVNGSEVATLDGDDSASWTEVIDLEGELTPGENTITADPGSRGELNLSLSSELFRQGRTEGS